MTRVTVRTHSADSEADITIDCPANLVTGESTFRGFFGEPSSLERDALLISSAIFAADRACPRSAREEYGRQIDLSVPAVNVGRWIPAKPSIERVLRALSNDDWRVDFRQHQGTVEPPRTESPTANGKTLLFSGGLDSLAAAIQFQDRSEDVDLVSHVTHSQAVRAAQHSLLDLLRTRRPVEHYQYLVSSRSGGLLAGRHDVENSQRTRSFMFLTLAALTARRTGRRDLVVIAENGPLAVHLPLTAARVGAFSTHTAHPDVLADMELVLREVFGEPFSISNPFLLMTKAEVVRLVLAALPDSIPVSSSCWRAARLTGGASHCGECVPCLIRRLAVEHSAPDRTGYGRDLLAENIKALSSLDIGRRNLIDLIEFCLKISRFSNEEIMNEWPDLYSPNLEPVGIIEMYRRFGRQTLEVLQRYPLVAPLLA